MLPSLWNKIEAVNVKMWNGSWVWGDWNEIFEGNHIFCLHEGNDIKHTGMCIINFCKPNNEIHFSHSEIHSVNWFNFSFYLYQVNISESFARVTWSSPFPFLIYFSLGISFWYISNNDGTLRTCEVERSKCWDFPKWMMSHNDLMTTISFASLSFNPWISRHEDNVDPVGVCVSSPLFYWRFVSTGELGSSLSSLYLNDTRRVSETCWMKKEEEREQRG